MNSVPEQSNDIPQMHSFAMKNSFIQTSNEIPSMNVLVATPNDNHKSLKSPLIVQQPHVQTVLLGQPMMRLPIVSNVLPTSFTIHPQLQPHQQQLQHFTPVLIH